MIQKLLKLPVTIVNKIFIAAKNAATNSSNYLIYEIENNVLVASIISEKTNVCNSPNFFAKKHPAYFKHNNQMLNMFNGRLKDESAIMQVDVSPFDAMRDIVSEIKEKNIYERVWEAVYALKEGLDSWQFYAILILIGACIVLPQMMEGQ